MYTYKVNWIIMNDIISKAKYWMINTRFKAIYIVFFIIDIVLFVCFFNKRKNKLYYSVKWIK